jgi:5-methylcytosine-specific restriction endonuclease McrA
MRNYKWRLAHPESYEKGMKKYKRTEKYRKIRRRQYIEFKDKTKEWVDNNRDRVNGYSRKRNQNKNHNISDVELQELYEYCNYSCMYCGISEKEAIELYGQKLHRDHAYNNGSHGIENCVLACKQCNSSKRDLDWDDWFQYPNSKYSIEKFNKIKNWLILKGNENLKSE